MRREARRLPLTRVPSVLARLFRHDARSLLALGAVLAVVLGALEWGRARATRHYWGRDLATWVRGLDASDTDTRDSAIVATSELAAAAWRDIDQTMDSSAPPRVAVLRAVAALGRRLGDPDSLLREHAATALLDIAVGGLDNEGRSSDGAADTARTHPLRVVARRAAGDLLRAVTHVGADVRALAPLEVLAALDASPDLVPTVDTLATRAASASVRALATTIALRPTAVPGDRRRRAALLGAALADPAAEVRLAAADALVRHGDDAALLRADDRLLPRACASLRDPDAAVRDALAPLVAGTTRSASLQCDS